MVYKKILVMCLILNFVWNFSEVKAGDEQTEIPIDQFSKRILRVNYIGENYGGADSQLEWGLKSIQFNIRDDQFYNQTSKNDFLGLTQNSPVLFSTQLYSSDSRYGATLSAQYSIGRFYKNLDSSEAQSHWMGSKSTLYFSPIVVAEGQFHSSTSDRHLPSQAASELGVQVGYVICSADRDFRLHFSATMATGICGMDVNELSTGKSNSIELKGTLEIDNHFIFESQFNRRSVANVRWDEQKMNLLYRFYGPFSASLERRIQMIESDGLEYQSIKQNSIGIAIDF